MLSNKNIVLTGMSGVGKTTIGKELSLIIDDYSFIDIDGEIEKSTNLKISEIFQKFGEQYFRYLEKETIKKYVNTNDKQIISIGGGAFEDEETRNLLLSNAYVIYLKASANTIYERIKNTTNRPLLKDISIEKIQSLTDKRIKNYEKAHVTIDTDNKNIYNVVKEIKECLKLI